MSYNYAAGDTGKSVDVQFCDDTGFPLTGKKAADFPPCKWSGCNNTADTVITLSDLTAITDAHPNNNVAGGVFEREGGWYRLDLPNNMLSVQGERTLIFVESTNKRIMAPRITVGPVPATVSGLTGVGARTVTITVNDGSAAIQNAKVRMTNGASSYVGTTDASGQVVFNLDDATWTVAISAAGYTFSGTSLVVSADVAHTYSMTLLVLTPSNPSFTTGFLTCYDQTGAAEAGVAISATLVQVGSSDTGHGYDGVAVTKTSDVNGLVQFTNLVLGAVYRFSRGTSDKSRLITIPSTAGASYALPSILGTP